MADRLVHIVDDAEVLADAGDLTLVVVLTGFLDAGKSAELAARHLSDLAEGKVVATFDVDALHDYRARRPPVTFVRDHYTDYEAPRLVVRALRDTGGTPFLLLAGPEPDIRWEAFARAVREVVERFDVSRVVSMGAVPMAVPHTRPIAITPARQPPRPRPRREPVAGRAARPGERAGAAGDPAGGVGHRRARLRRPHPALPRADGVPPGRARAARAPRDRRSPHHRPRRAPRGGRDHRGRGRPLPLDPRRGRRRRPRARAAVRLLPRGRGRRHARCWPATSRCPTGEEIGSDFEAFLADLDDQSKDNGDDAGGWDGR